MVLQPLSAWGHRLQMSEWLNSSLPWPRIQPYFSKYRYGCLGKPTMIRYFRIELTRLKIPPREPAAPSLGQSLGLTPRKKLSLSRSICSLMLSNGSTPSRSWATDRLPKGSGSPFWPAILPESVTVPTFGECSRSHCSKWSPVRLASWPVGRSDWPRLTHVSGEESGDVTLLTLAVCWLPLDQPVQCRARWLPAGLARDGSAHRAESVPLRRIGHRSTETPITQHWFAFTCFVKFQSELTESAVEREI